MCFQFFKAYLFYDELPGSHYVNISHLNFNLTGCGPSLKPNKCKVFVALNLLFPTQLSANHRTDHHGWEWLWQMTKPKLSTGVTMTSWNASCVLQSKAVLLFLSVSAVNLQPSCSHKLPVGFPDKFVFVHRNGCSLKELHHLNTFHCGLQCLHAAHNLTVMVASSKLISSLDDCVFPRLWAIKDSLWSHQTHLFIELHWIYWSIRVKSSITNIIAQGCCKLAWLAT